MRVGQKHKRRAGDYTKQMWDRAKQLKNTGLRNGYTIVLYDITQVILEKNTSDGNHVLITVQVPSLSTSTVLNHPKQGMNRLLRDGMDLQTTKKVIENPRLHTSEEVKSRHF